MRPQARVALTGPNGSGKSTLIAYLRPFFKADPEQIVYVPQEISQAESRQVMAGVRALSRARLGRLLTIVSSLGSRPQRLLESDNPSPGEIRKILLASGIERSPHVIIMDEPTNHMDLPSIRCLEQALADCPCGLLLVSHDRVSLNYVTNEEWHLEMDGQTSRLVITP
jgi:ATPase subunit of ABC transporter with duplicated ATPase domains